RPDDWARSGWPDTRADGAVEQRTFLRRRDRRGGRRSLITGVLLDAVADDRLAGGGRMSAHAVHWWAQERGVRLAVAAFLSCLLVGSILVPVAHYMRIPFAAVGFASVVALVPGLFVFRTLSGLAQFADAPSPALLSAAASNLIVASITVAGMALGLALPMHVFTGVWRRRHEL